MMVFCLSDDLLLKIVVGFTVIVCFPLKNLILHYVCVNSLCHGQTVSNRKESQTPMGILEPYRKKKFQIF